LASMPLSGFRLNTWRARHSAGLALAVAVLATVSAVAQTVQTPLVGVIYVCDDDSGRRLTADRPIAACMDRPQRILGPDGRQRGTLAPPMTTQQRLDKEAKEAREAQELVVKAEAARRDRLLLSRFKDEASHQAIRDFALDGLRIGMELSRNRIKALTEERSQLDREVAPYKGQALPATIGARVTANAASMTAQSQALDLQHAEYNRISARYDVELARLKSLWAGAMPGSLGMLVYPGQ
jgi:hypothetical protein